MNVGETLPPRNAKLWIFDRVPVTLNRLLRMHWGAKKRDLESWGMWVLGVAGKGPQPRGRVQLKITVYRAKLQDPDNSKGSVKPLVDALKAGGWMRDDSREWLDLEVEERVEREKKLRRTEIYWEARVDKPQAKS
jgi:hypothetical protein